MHHNLSTPRSIRAAIRSKEKQRAELLDQCDALERRLARHADDWREADEERDQARAANILLAWEHDRAALGLMQTQAKDLLDECTRLCGILSRQRVALDAAA